MPIGWNKDKLDSSCRRGVRMDCPGPDEDSYRICVYCRACYPGLSPRVQELLDITTNDLDDYITTGQLVEGVMA